MAHTQNDVARLQADVARLQADVARLEAEVARMTHEKKVASETWSYVAGNYIADEWEGFLEWDAEEVEVEKGETISDVIKKHNIEHHVADLIKLDRFFGGEYGDDNAGAGWESDDDEDS